MNILVGLEFEFEINNIENRITLESNVAISQINNIGYEIVYDDSLRNGYEIRLHTPLPLNEAVESVYQLYKFLEANNIEINISERTSTHVHLNATDCSKHIIDELLKLYLCYEKILFRIAALHRIRSNYCVPLLYRMSSLKYQKDKYDALNLKPLSTFGSIEFRHFHSSPNPDEVVNWIKICSTMLSFVKQGNTIDDINLDNPFEIFNGLIASTSLNVKDFKYSLARVKTLIK